MKTQRRAINPGGNLALQMAEGNIGAATVCMDMMLVDQMMGMMAMLHLDDMNMRGEQIYVGRKLYETTEAFIEAINKRDKALVEYVNKNSTIGETAVEHGASYKHRR